jgi:hypothetical protein
MFIQINPTQKSQLLFSELSRIDDESEAKKYSGDYPIFSWHASSFTCERKKCIILVNDLTSLTVVISDVNAKMKKHLDEWIKTGIKQVFVSAGIDELDIETYFAIASNIRIFKAHNRSTIKTITHIDDRLCSLSSITPIDLNEHLQQELSYGINRIFATKVAKYKSPNESIKEYFASEDWKSLSKETAANVKKEYKYKKGYITKTNKFANSYIDLVREKYSKKEQTSADETRNNLDLELVDKRLSNKEALMKLKNQFEVAIKKHKLKLNWNAIIETVKSHKKKDSPNVIIEKLYNEKSFKTCSADAFQEIVSIVINMYNFTPNNEDGLSPNDRIRRKNRR